MRRFDKKISVSKGNCLQIIPKIRQIEKVEITNSYHRLLVLLIDNVGYALIDGWDYVTYASHHQM